MLQGLGMAGLVKLQRSICLLGQWPLWAYSVEKLLLI